MAAIKGILTPPGVIGGKEKEKIPSGGINRREFLKLVAGFTGGAALAAELGVIGGVVAHAAFPEAKEKFNLERRLLSDRFNLFLGTGAIDKEGYFDIPNYEPEGDIRVFDFSAQLPLIYPVIEKMTNGFDKVVPYSMFLSEASNSPISLWGEAHSDGTGKQVFREAVYRAVLEHPDVPIIVALGRFSPDNNEDLSRFVHGTSKMSDKDALSYLTKATGFESNWFDLAYFMDSMNFDTSGYAHELLLFRYLGVSVVGIGVDNGNKQSVIGGDDNNFEGNYSVREQRAAEELARLEKQHPGAIIMAQCGLIHAQRGQSGEGIAPKLEEIHRQDAFLRGRFVVVTETADTVFFNGQSVEEIKSALKGIAAKRGQWASNKMINEIFPEVALAIRKPNYTAASWLLDTPDEITYKYPGADWAVIRLSGDY